MRSDRARAIIFQVLEEVAPEVDPARVADTTELTTQLDLDSMDYLSWLIGISEATGIDIPHWDVDRFTRIDSAVEYLVARSVED